MPKYALLLEYNGKNYSGFQYQKNAPSVQAELEKTFHTLLYENVRLHPAGRTDAGVHAIGQVLSFSIEKELICTKNSNQKSSDLNDFVYRLNALLPKDIGVRALQKVDDSFHARYSCIARRYEYLIWNSNFRSVKWYDQALWVRQKLDLERLNLELKTIIGFHNFESFAKEDEKQKNTFRHIYQAYFSEDRDEKELIRFSILANSFLYNMIRILLGTLLDIHFGRLKGSLQSILMRKVRKEAGRTIAPKGLYFIAAYYPNTIKGLGKPFSCISNKNFIKESV